MVFVWEMFPEVGGQKSPEGLYSQKAAGEPREGREQLEKNLGGGTVWAVPRASGPGGTLPQTSQVHRLGVASASCPNHKGCAGCLAHFSGLAKTGGQMRVSVCGSSAGQKRSAPCASCMLVGPQVPLGNSCAVKQ